MKIELIHGDCLEKLKDIEDCSVDSIITDPPYGISFMGKKWDYDIPSVEIWKECLRVLKPGGHLLAFAGTKTQHRMCTNIEDAGFEIRDMLAWVYGSGFPKSMDVSKAIDKSLGAEREVVGFDIVAARRTPAVKTTAYGDYKGQTGDITAPATDAAKQWDGRGTALKPALEPITLARKPLEEKTVADNVLKYGTGAINVKDCRIGNETLKEVKRENRTQNIGTFEHPNSTTPERVGRYPANFLHDGSSEIEDILKDKTRFFYCAKASNKDRNEGSLVKNNHPTVKPTELMRYLCKLITPPNGTVLDPFMGSGSTGKACVKESFNFIGIEREEEYFEIAKARINNENN